jgi:3-oxoacyl-[acyl-carrier-protein] synthase II
MSDYVKFTLAATALAMQDAKIMDVAAFAETGSVILGSTHGSTNYSNGYYKQIVAEGIAAANPMLFAEGVPNAAAAHLSLMLSLKGACQTIIGSRTAGLDALRLASARIATGAWDRAIVGAAEEYDPIVNSCYKHCRTYAGENGAPPFEGRGFVTTAAAVTLILESRRSLENRSLRPHGRLVAATSARSSSGPPIHAAQQVLDELNAPAQVVGSANGTWVDRAETLAIAKANRDTTVSTLYGHVAEAFSVGPLLAIAAALGSRKLPRVLSPASAESGGAVLARECQPIGSPFGVLCTDYSGVVSGAAVAPMDR